MITTSVKDLSSIMTFVNPAANTARKGFETDNGFQDVMTKAESGQTKTDIGSAQSKSSPRDSFTRQIDKSNRTERISESDNESPEDVDKVMDNLDKAGRDIIKEVAKEVDCTEEEVVEAMTNMGLSPISLLDPSIIGDLVTELSGEDPIALVTSGDYFESVKNLTTLVDATLADLASDMDMEVSSIEKLVESAEIQPIMDEEIEMSVEINSDSLNIQKKSPIITVNDETKEIDSDIEEEIPEKSIGKVDSKVNTNTGNDEVQTDAGKPKGNREQKESLPEKSTIQTKSSSAEGQNVSGIKNPILDNTFSRTINNIETPTTQSSFFSEETKNIMNQIMDYMKINVKAETEHLEMQLHPASLGNVKINITANKAGEVTAEFKVQNEQVKAAVEAQLNELRETFKASGSKVTEIEVHVEMQSFDSNLWQGKGHETDSDSGNSRSGRRRKINLNELDALFEDENNEEDALAAEMMQAAGNTVDFMA